MESELRLLGIRLINAPILRPTQNLKVDRNIITREQEIESAKSHTFDGLIGIDSINQRINFSVQIEINTKIIFR
jgi:hypothetical protein